MPRAGAGRPALAALSLAMLLSSLGTSAANVALPTLQLEFGAPLGGVQWVVIAYLLAVTKLVVGVGRLGDLVGRRRLLVAGVATFTVASGGCAAAPGLWALVGARALQGAGAAAMMALSLALVSEAVPRERAGGAMGLLGSTSAVGTALGPSLGGVLVAGPGWRAIFLANVPLGLAALGLAWRHLPADPGRAAAAGPRFDRAGTLLLALALGAYSLAMTTGGTRPGALGAALLLGALAAGAAFVVVERRSAAPLIDAATIRGRGLGAGLTVSALVSTVMMASLVVGPFHLSHVLALGPAQAGLVMSAGPAVVALAGVPAGRLADRAGARRVTLAGLAVMAGGSTLLSLAPPGAGVAGWVGPVVVLTAGYALVQTANNATVMGAADAGRRGVTSGVLTLSRNLGLITGASVMGAVFALAAGTTEVASAPLPDVADGTRTTFAVCTLLLVGAIVAAAGRAPGRRGAAATAPAAPPAATRAHRGP